MRIKRILSQHRRDFQALYKCEHCDHEEKGSGYDDAHFHQNVVPGKVCPKCGKKAPEGYRPLATKHAERTVV